MLLGQASYVADYVLLFAVRHVLDRENKRRDTLQLGHAQEHYGYVERVDMDGHVSHQKVDMGLLDLTDRENLLFRYSL